MTASRRESVVAAITAKAANGVMHVYPVVIAAIAAISNPSHRGRNHTVGRSVISGSSLEDRLKVVAPGQVSWLSYRPTPRVFPASRPVTLAGFVPDYSDGVAAVSHRLPWALMGIPGAFTVKLFECRRDCKPASRRRPARCAKLGRRRQPESLPRQQLPSAVLLLPDLKGADPGGRRLTLELRVGQVDVAHDGGIADHRDLQLGEGERLDRLLTGHHAG